MPNPFAIVVCHDSGHPIVRVRGEVDVSNADTVTEALRALANVGERRVDLDFGAVTFMDSTGVRSVLDGLRFGLDLRVVAASARVDRVLEIAGILALLEDNTPSPLR
jgi:anti-anti-sigma factor